MVRIGLKSQFVDLIVTLLSGAAELCLLHAAFTLNRYAECKTLKRGKQVSVRLHQKRTQLFAALSLLIFIVMEIILSFLSDPLPGHQIEVRRCASVDRYDSIPTNVFSNDIDNVLLQCVRVERGQVFQRVGNISLRDGEVRCSRSAIYEITGQIRTMMAITNNQTKSCRDDFGCVFTEVISRVVYVSAAVQIGELDILTTQAIPIPFLMTPILFDVDKEQEAVLSRKALTLFTENVNDPWVLREKIFTGSITNSSCPFDVLQDDVATEVPLTLIYIFAATWIFSLFAFIATFFFNHYIFYDMSNPLHWAQRTFRYVDEPVCEDPVVTSVYEHGERIMYVTGPSSNEFNFLNKLNTYVLEEVKHR